MYIRCCIQLNMLEHYCLTEKNMMPRKTEKQMHSHMQNLANKHRIQISFNSIYWLSLCTRQYMLGTMKKRYKYERIISMQNWNFKSWLFSLALYRAWMQFKDIFVFALYKMCEELFNALKWVIVCLGWKEQESTINSCSHVRDCGAYEITRIFEQGYSPITASFPPLRPVLVNRKEWLGCM